MISRALSLKQAALYSHAAPAPAGWARTCCACGAEFKADHPRSRKCAGCLGAGREFKPSPRHQHIMALLRLGLANKEIAARLTLSEGTVKTYFNRLYKGLGVQSRLELLLLVIDKELAAKDERIRALEFQLKIPLAHCAVPMLDSGQCPTVNETKNPTL